MRRIIALVLCVIMAGMCNAASAAGIELYYDGEYHTYTGSIFSLYVNGEKITPPMEPIVFNNRALVPLREVFEALGAVVDYDNDTREITVSGNNISVKLQIGNNTAYINGEKTAIPDGVVPKLITKKGNATKTMVPVRFISESIGLNVDFDDKAGAIKIKSKEEQNVIKKPAVNKKSDTVTVITLNLTMPLKNEIKAAVTDSGVIYFDILNAVYEDASKTEINHGAVLDIRLGLHEDYTRVAVDTKEYKSYGIEQSADKKTVTITVTAKEKAQKPDDSTKSEDEKKPADNTKDEENTENEENNKNQVKVSVNVKSLLDYTSSNGKKYVVIDAGHGGTDPGAIGKLTEETEKEDGETEKKTVSYNEKDITLSVAKLVKKNLEESGISVIMTRTGDTYPSLSDRSALANKKDAAMFVSIHVNSAANAPNANGIEVYYATANNKKYYGITSKELADSVLKSLISSTGALSRGVKTEAHYVTRTSFMPAILAEIGFINNETELKKLVSSEYQKKIAKGISDAVVKQLSKVTVPDREELAEKLVAEEIGKDAAKEYMSQFIK